MVVLGRRLRSPATQAVAGRSLAGAPSLASVESDVTFGLMGSMTLAPFGPNERMSVCRHGNRDDFVAPGADTVVASAVDDPELVDVIGRDGAMNTTSVSSPEHGRCRSIVRAGGL
jgi:hypothetical protein